MRVHIILENQPEVSNESAHYFRQLTSTKQ